MAQANGGYGDAAGFGAAFLGTSGLIVAGILVLLALDLRER
jgi:hypothetical protein